jgi:hypothetical protein
MHYNDQRNFLSKQTSFALIQSQSRPSMTIPRTTNYVWDRHPLLRRSSIQNRRFLTFLTNPHFSQRRVETKNHQASQPSTIGCVNKVSQVLHQVQQQGSRSSRLFPVDKSNHQDLLRRQVRVKISTASFVVTYFCRDPDTHCSS